MSYEREKKNAVVTICSFVKRKFHYIGLSSGLVKTYSPTRNQVSELIQVFFVFSNQKQEILERISTLKFIHFVQTIEISFETRDFFFLTCEKKKTSFA